jgi:predicted dehydrogenase
MKPIETIRIGIVGAGANTRLRHIPGFVAQAGVEIVAVCNRTQESSERSAREYGIPRVYHHWPELVSAENVDAVLIGTWPYLHCPITIAALQSGKHVLTEARMAMNASEARRMLESSRMHPELVTQIVPAPPTLRVDRMVKQLLADGYTGELYAVEVKVHSGQFADFTKPLHWRHDRDLSGMNTLSLGIWYECLLRWIGEAKQVMALTRVNVPQRRDAQGVLRTISVPDHVDVIASMRCGAQGHFQFSDVAGLAPGTEVWLFGRNGTLRYDAATDKLFGGRPPDGQLREIAIPPELESRWRVEEEFVNAIRGKELVALTNFEDGLKYMQFTEAVSRSAASGSAIDVQDL